MIDDTMFKYKTFSPTCLFCKYLISDDKRTCKAFIDGIPMEIWNGDIDHDKPYPGDGGIQREDM